VHRGPSRTGGIAGQHRVWSHTYGVGDCCGSDGYDETFSDRFARRMARRYRRRGLSRSARAIVSFLADRGIEGASILEIGGGVGELHVELLRDGAAKATNLEISTNYEAEAAQLLESAGMAARVERRFLDIAQAPEEVELADVVVLHRVVCCYPDYERLLSAAASKAGRLLVFSHPPDNLLTRAMFAGENGMRRLKGEAFRAFIHPPAAMRDAAVRSGLRDTYRWRGIGWCVVGLER
jgi:cyclopropane fatty-acyl-phospholipid synthase-like methyltransferase